MKKDLIWNIILRKVCFCIVKIPKFKGRYYILSIVSKLFRVPKGPVIIRVHKDFQLEVNPSIDRGVESALFFNGTYEIGTLNYLADNLRDGDVFVDVGANIGLMTIIASRLVGDKGRVVAFEPNKNTFNILQRNIELNKLSNVTLIRKAVSDQPGKALLYENWSINRGGASIIRNEDREEGVEIDVSTIDLELKKLNLKPRLIKVDVEGLELQVLKGTLNTLQESKGELSVIVEISKDRLQGGFDSDEIMQFLLLKGFQPFINEKGKESNSAVTPLTKGHWDKINHDNVYFSRDIN